MNLSELSEYASPFQEEVLPRQEPQTDTEEMRPAGFLRRALAFTIDCGVILMLFQSLLLAGLYGLQLSESREGLGVSDLGLGLINSLLFIALAYFSFFHAACGQSPGKMILRIKVVTKDLRALSPFRAFIRAVSYFLSGLFFGLGFLITIFDGKKRALHDLLTGTQVILTP